MSSSSVYPSDHGRLPPTPPPNLAPFIFILSDHESMALACDVAQALEKLDEGLRVWWFNEPVHEAASVFIDDLDWNIALGDPRTHSHGDLLKSLATWVDGYFTEAYLGTYQFMEARACHEMGNDGTIVFPDANWTHIKPFIDYFKPHHWLIVQLTPMVPNIMQVVGSGNYKPDRHLMFAAPTVESVVAAIVEASK